MKFFDDIKSNFYNIFKLKCVSITNTSVDHYKQGVTR